ncbi:hypothetical protein [Sphingobacterium sp. MYb382]|uniref:hypothetical protein n=1 Tax=Sphingobacterium sp. MYb382 TaxID=2745278 RepID=UPI003094D9CA
MKRFHLLLLAALCLTGCNENKNSTKNCAIELKEFLKDELKCSKAGEMQVNLFVGNYEGQQVYFTMLVCPACDAQSPSYGYTCAKTKIPFRNFDDVKYRKLVYNSCEDTFEKSL